MASVFADGFQRNNHFAKHPRRNFTTKRDGGQHHHQGTVPLGNTKSFTRPTHHPRNSNTPDAMLSLISAHHGGSNNHNSKPQAQNGAVGVAPKPKSSSSSLMQSAQRNRNISLILLLLATETVVSITQPHFLGNSGLANTGVCIAGAAGEWREVRGGHAPSGGNMRSSPANAPDGRPTAIDGIDDEDGEVVMSELTMACRPPAASSSSAHLSIELFAADRFQKFHDQFDNHAAIHTDAASAPPSSYSSVSPKCKIGSHHHESMSSTKTSSILNQNNKIVPTDESRARSEGESDQETNDGASCSSDSFTTTAEEGNTVRSSVESSLSPPQVQKDTTNRKDREADYNKPSKESAAAVATPILMMLMTESASGRMTSADDLNATCSSVCASSFASSTATPITIASFAAGSSSVEVKGAAYSPESSNKNGGNQQPSLLSTDAKTLKAIFSFLSWREVVNVRGVSTLWFFESLNFAAICRMPASLTPAVFIPYPFQEFSAVGVGGVEGRENEKSSPSVVPNLQSIFGGNTIYPGGMGSFAGNAGLFGGGKKIGPSSYLSPTKGEAVSWNNLTKSWRCAACGNINSHFRATCNHSHALTNNNSNAEPKCVPPVNHEDDFALASTRTLYSRNSSSNGNGTTVVCNTANPLHWNSERLFLGQLRRDGTIPFVLWLLRDVLGIDMSRILVVENHRDRTTGRGKGCAWVTVAMPPSSEIYEGNPCPPRSLSNALLSLHHRAFFDTLNGVEGLWITTPKLSSGLDSETSLRSSAADTGPAATNYNANATSNHMNTNTSKNNHPKHMPRTSVVVEETSPQMTTINEIIGRHRNSPVHYVRELRTVLVKGTESIAELGEKENHEAVAELSSDKISVSSSYYEIKQRRPEIRTVHNPYYSHVAFLANQPTSRQQLAGNAHPPTTTTTIASTLLAHASATHSHTRATLSAPSRAAAAMSY